MGRLGVGDAGDDLAFLLVLFLGYLAVRRLPGDPAARSKRAAIAGLVAFIDVPLVHYSVSWWRTLTGTDNHRLDPQIDGLMLFTFVVGLAAVSLWYVWLVIHRFRVAYLEAARRAALPPGPDRAASRGRRRRGGRTPGARGDLTVSYVVIGYPIVLIALVPTPPGCSPEAAG